MKRIIVSSLTAAAAYYLTESPILSFFLSGTTYVLYEPDYVPYDVDNLPLMYLVMLLRRRKAAFDHFFMHFGLRYKSELERRRQLSAIKTRLCPNVSEEIINFKDFELYKFTPDHIESKKAIIYFHGGGFVMSDIPFYRQFCSTMGTD